MHPNDFYMQFYRNLKLKIPGLKYFANWKPLQYLFYNAAVNQYFYNIYKTKLEGLKNKKIKQANKCINTIFMKNKLGICFFQNHDTEFLLF